MIERMNKPVVETYTDLAKKYDVKFASYLDATFKVAVDALALKGDERILDVACGTGELERILPASFPKVKITGIDVTNSMLKIAREKCGHNPNLKFLHMQSQKLDFDNESFDIVITCSAFHYMRNPEMVLAECQRVLATGGRFILIDWCRDFLWSKFYNSLFKLYKRSHYKVYTIKEIKNLLLEAKLSPKNIETFAIPPFWRMMCVTAKKEDANMWADAIGG